MVLPPFSPLKSSESENPSAPTIPSPSSAFYPCHHRTVQGCRCDTCMCLHRGTPFAVSNGCFCDSVVSETTSPLLLAPVEGHHSLPELQHWISPQPPFFFFI